MENRNKKQAGFSLIELLFAMAVVLLLVAGLAIAGEKSLQAGRETSATQSVQSFTGYETTYQTRWNGFSRDAASLGGAGLATPAVCTADQEMVTTTGSNPSPASFDAGQVQAGYTFQYLASGTGFNATGTCAQLVQPSYDFTANPVDQKTKSFCADNTGTYYLPAGTAMTNNGKGCIADNPSAFPVGQ